MSYESARSRVALELNTEDLPELMEMLGGFVTQHSLNVAIQIPWVSDESETSPRINSPAYNPDFVTMIDIDHAGEETPVVIEGNFLNFSNDTGILPYGRRLLKRLRYDMTDPRSQLRGDYRAVLEPCLALSSKGELIGIRADHLQKLLNHLKSEDVRLHNVSTKVFGYLEEYLKQMTKEADDEA